MSPALSSLIFGLVGSVVVAVIAAIFARRKTDADVKQVSAEAADLLSQGAARLVPYYEAPDRKSVV